MPLIIRVETIEPNTHNEIRTQGVGWRHINLVKSGMLDNSGVILKKASQVTIGWAHREIGGKSLNEVGIKSETPLLKIGEKECLVQEGESQANRVIENTSKMRFLSKLWSNGASVQITMDFTVLRRINIELIPM